MGDWITVPEHDIHVDGFIDVREARTGNTGSSSTRGAIKPRSTGTPSAGDGVRPTTSQPQHPGTTAATTAAESPGMRTSR
jgi:hypothetical protein